MVGGAQARKIYAVEISNCLDSKETVHSLLRFSSIVRRVVEELGTSIPWSGVLRL